MKEGPVSTAAERQQHYLVIMSQETWHQQKRHVPRKGGFLYCRVWLGHDCTFRHLNQQLDIWFQETGTKLIHKMLQVGHSGRKTAPVLPQRN